MRKGRQLDRRLEGRAGDKCDGGEGEADGLGKDVIGEEQVSWCEEGKDRC